MTNLQGAGAFKEEIQAVARLSPDEFASKQGENVIVLDTRGADPFAAGYIRGRLVVVQRSVSLL
jgi:hypothetical protein